MQRMREEGAAGVIDAGQRHGERPLEDEGRPVVRVIDPADVGEERRRLAQALLGAVLALEQRLGPARDARAHLGEAAEMARDVACRRE